MPKESRKRAKASSVLSRLVASRVPLRWRLRNPPPLFLGRARERAQLEEALARAPVTVVCGPGGIGKTSLVLRVLGDASRPSELFIGVSPGDRSGEQAAHEVLGALGEMLGGREIGRGVLKDRDALLATCIDLADALDALVVIDDLHHAEGMLLEDLLASAATYARRSRWIATSRTIPRAAGLTSHTIALGPMTRADLEELARRAAPQLGEREIAAVAEAAEGSPFWLWQRIVLGRSGASRTDLLAGIEPGLAGFVRALAQLEIPLPLDALDAVGVPPPSPEALEGLEQRGLLEQTAAGVRLHAVARGALVSADGAAVARALARAASPTLRIESVRLALAAGQTDAACVALAHTVDEALQAGLAPRLWQVLAPHAEPRLQAAKLACAADLGGGGAAEWALGLPAPAAPSERLSWVTVLAQSARLEEAAATAEALAAELLEAEPERGAEALLAAVRARVARAEAAAALALADSVRRALGEMRPDLRALADVWSARAHVFLGAHTQALAIVDALGERGFSAAPTVEREIDDQRAVVYSNLGRLRSSRAAFDRAGGSGVISPDRFGARERLARSSASATESGRLADARALLDELAPVARRSEELFAFHCMNELRYWAALGDLDEARRHLGHLEQAVRASASGYWAWWVASPVHYLGVLQGLSFDSTAAAAPTDFPLTRALAAWHEVVATGGSERLAREGGTDVVDASIVLAIAGSCACLLAGDGRGALRKAREAVARARAEGLVLYEADAQLAVADAAFAGGLDGLETAIEDLGALARALGPTRIDHELRWLRELARGEQADASVFDALAASRYDGPAARRCRALLGTQTRRDRVDELVVARAKELLGLESLGRPASRARPGLGLDTRHGRVQLPGGRSIDLSARPQLMRLLTALFEAGGEATKEALVAAVWGISEYHPLRDDKRLQVAVRRLRVLLEPAPDDPAIVETTDTGYRIAQDLLVYRVGAV